VHASAESRARARLREAALELPEYVPPQASYLPLRVHAGIAYCAGVTSEGIAGRVGAELDLEQARTAARICATRQLAALEHALGTLDDVELVLRLTGYVACVEGFGDCPAVIDAASEVFVTAFGDEGRHARSAIGVLALPGNAAVELEAIVALRAAS
jgi:enamine deaminase RidA (YjgF/YER057c/UK114 family)